MADFNPCKKQLVQWIKQYKFKVTKKNKLKVDLKHLIYYILLWIVYIDNIYSIYLVSKKKY